jgi:hypothetical protein
MALLERSQLANVHANVVAFDAYLKGLKQTNTPGPELSQALNLAVASFQQANAALSDFDTAVRTFGNWKACLRALQPKVDKAVLDGAVLDRMRP